MNTKQIITLMAMISVLLFSISCLEIDILCDPATDPNGCENKYPEGFETSDRGDRINSENNGMDYSEENFGYDEENYDVESDGSDGLTSNNDEEDSLDLDSKSNDTTLPVSTITDYPDELTNVSTATFTFTATETSTFECKLDKDKYSSCNSPKQYSNITEGEHTFYVRAIDLAKNKESKPIEYKWTYDKTPPDITIDTYPNSSTNTNVATFTFSALEDAIFYCAVDAGNYEVCSSPIAYYNISAEKEHTFFAKGIDLAGNALSTPEMYAWTYDITAPDTTISSKPANPSNTSTFLFTSSETSTFECKVDSGSYSSCNSPKVLTGISDGSHTLYVRAIDSAGNTDATPASHTWVYDGSQPETTIVSMPNNPGNTATFEFTSNEAVTFECNIGHKYLPCTSPKAYTGLSEGIHTFYVKAIDQTGNSDNTPASYSWNYDTQGPVITIQNKPANPTDSPAAIFTFVADESASFQCKLDSGEYSSCTSPKSFIDLNDGYHTFYIKATDYVGNTSANTTSYSWTFFPYTYGWTKTFGGSGYDSGDLVALDSEDNIYVVGLFTGTVDFDFTTNTDAHTSNGNKNIFITKINSDGSYGWTRTFGGNSYSGLYPTSLAIDNADSIYITGAYSWTVDFDPTSGVDNHTAIGGYANYDVFVVKINSNGSFGWAKTFGGSSGDYSYSVATDNLNNVYLTGYYTGATDSNIYSQISLLNIFAIKINSNGSLGWIKTFRAGGRGGFGGVHSSGDTSELDVSISTDSLNNIYVASRYWGTVDFDFTSGTDNHSTNSYEDAVFLTKINSDGTYGWTKTFGSTNVTRCKSIVINSLDDIYITGYFYGTGDFDFTSGIDNHTSKSSLPSIVLTQYDIFITKINSDGSYGWTKTFAYSSTIYSEVTTVIDDLDNIFITDRSLGTIDFDFTSGTDYNGGLYVTKINSDGSYGWTKILGGANGGSNGHYGNSLVIDNFYNIYVIANYIGSIDFDFTSNTDNRTSNGDEDIFITKLEFNQE